MCELLAASGRPAGRADADERLEAAGEQQSVCRSDVVLLSWRMRRHTVGCTICVGGFGGWVTGCGDRPPAARLGFCAVTAQKRRVISGAPCRPADEAVLIV